MKILSKVPGTARVFMWWTPFVVAGLLVARVSAGPDARPGQTDSPGSDAEQRASDEDDAAGAPLSLIVDFRDDIGDDALAANAYVEEPISQFSRFDRLYRVRFTDRIARDRALAALRRDPNVESADFDVDATISPFETSPAPFASDRPNAPSCDGKSKDGAAQTRGFPDDPCYRYQWHLNQIGLPASWKSGQGKGAVVAVIDTGVSRVPDLENTTFVAGYNFVDDNADAHDDHGHGTHVAGTIAQSTHNGVGVSGIAFQAAIMPLKVLSAGGSGSMAAIAQAIRYAADHGANVVNMSLGGPFPVGAIDSAVTYARKKGVLVVAAAGNDGRGRVSYPARYPGVIAVAATQFDETTTFYSNWGKQIDIAAPGGNVRIDQNGDGLPDGVLQNTVVPGNTTVNDYLFFMGTSMACPHVAGVAALLYGAGVNRPEKVEQILIDTARRPRASSAALDGQAGRFNDHYGAGIVDAGRALARAKTSRDGGAFALAATLAFAVGMSPRRRKGSRLPLAAGILLGASGLGALSLLGIDLPGSGPIALLSVGAPLSLAGLISPTAVGNPFLLSALLPFAALALGFGIRRAQPLLAGFAFGVAGLLVSLAIGHQLDVSYVPDLLDRTWLAANAVVCAVLGALTLSRRA